MNGLLLKESLNLLNMSASNLSDIKADVRGMVLLSYCLNKRELILPDILNRLIITHNHNLNNFI